MSSTVVAAELGGVQAGYGKKVVLDGLSVRVRSAAVTGLLGPNGAGKSTLLSVMASLLPPRGGSVVVAGCDLGEKTQRRRARAELSFLPQDFSVDERLTVEKFVSYSLWLREYPKPEIPRATAEALELVNLAQWKSSRISELSGGLRQRAGLAAVCAGYPTLIILDEPTVGLDPEQRSHFRHAVGEIAKKGSAVIFSTHIVEDVAAIAEDLIVLNEGAITYAGPACVLHDTSGGDADSLERAYRSLLIVEGL